MLTPRYLNAIVLLSLALVTLFKATGVSAIIASNYPTPSPSPTPKCLAKNGCWNVDCLLDDIEDCLIDDGKGKLTAKKIIKLKNATMYDSVNCLPDQIVEALRLAVDEREASHTTTDHHVPEPTSTSSSEGGGGGNTFRRGMAPPLCLNYRIGKERKGDNDEDEADDDKKKNK